MTTNIIREVAQRAMQRENDEYGFEMSPDRLAANTAFVAPIVADVLDILSADGRIVVTSPAASSEGSAS